MISKKKKPRTISEYIHRCPKQARAKLREMRTCIREAAPGAKESLKWGMPAFSTGNILVMFAGYEHHIGFYPMPSAIKAFGKDLAKYKTGRGSIQFSLDKPLPRTLIRKIIHLRVQEIRDKSAKWKS